jgi:hypothetical protein
VTYIKLEVITDGHRQTITDDTDGNNVLPGLCRLVGAFAATRPAELEQLRRDAALVRQIYEMLASPNDEVDAPCDARDSQSRTSERGDEQRIADAVKDDDLADVAINESR